MPKRRLSRKTRSPALRTVLDNPALPAFVRSLGPRTLARMCQRMGVRDAAAVMALAPTQQLLQALDVSVWKSPRPGLPEAFQASALIDWIGAWLEIGSAFTAEQLAAVSDEDLTLYLSHVIQVSTTAMWGFERSTEIGNLDRIYAPSDDEMAYGSYVVRARKNEEWETIRAALDAMWSDAPERLLRLFAQITGDESMLAPDPNREGSTRDSISRRESSGERRGHVTATGARAFLTFGTRRSIEDLVSLSEYDLETRRHISGLATTEEAEPQDRPFAHDPAFTETEPSENRLTLVHTDHLNDPDPLHLAALRLSLEAAGLIDRPAKPRLLQHEGAFNQLPIVKLVEQLADEHPMAFDARARELAYLASVLIAGIAVEDRPFVPEEARSAALATCNLGLEVAEARGERVRIEAEPGLVGLFLVGWRALTEVPGRVLNAFTDSLTALRLESLDPLHVWLVEQAEGSVSDLREAISKQDFTAAREAVTVLGFVFDPKVCREIVPLLDELPHLSAGEHGAQWIDSLQALERVGQLAHRLFANYRT